ncbi:hypothetical protein DINM_005204 [Dirofilaria immitis]|nr:hypothetical protein [Dirofilaria immitis]
MGNSAIKTRLQDWKFESTRVNNITGMDAVEDWQSAAESVHMWHAPQHPMQIQLSSLGCLDINQRNSCRIPSVFKRWIYLDRRNFFHLSYTIPLLARKTATIGIREDAKVVADEDGDVNINADDGKFGIKGYQGKLEMEYISGVMT